MRELVLEEFVSDMEYLYMRPTYVSTSLLDQLLVITCFRDSAFLEEVDDVGILIRE